MYVCIYASLLYFVLKPSLERLSSLYEQQLHSFSYYYFAPDNAITFLTSLSGCFIGDNLNRSTF